MNCKPTPSQKEPCYFWHSTDEKCTDTAEYVNQETGEPMCRYNDSAVHVSEYRKISADSGAGEHISQQPQEIRDVLGHIHAQIIRTIDKEFGLVQAVIVLRALYASKMKDEPGDKTLGLGTAKDFVEIQRLGFYN